MNKEELFLKYIDNQLIQKQKLEVELMISENNTDKHLFEKVRETRKEILKTLDLLNPDDPIAVPLFESKKRETFQIKWRHYVAMAAILVGLFFGIKQLLNSEEVQDSELVSNNIEESKTIYKELDCYISPNRCWNQKQLVWTFIEINH